MPAHKEGGVMMMERERDCRLKIFKKNEQEKQTKEKLVVHFLFDFLGVAGKQLRNDWWKTSNTTTTTTTTAVRGLEKDTPSSLYIFIQPWYIDVYNIYKTLKK